MRSVFISIVRVFFFLLLPCSFTTLAQQDFSVRDNYKKMEVTISMRDGTKLFTSIYLPKDDSQKYPILLNRTPYSVSPYGAEAYRESLGPSSYFPPEKYIFVYQDVRGRLMSEGDFKMMTPFKTEKKSSSDVDESTDTYDTIEWLLKNIPNNNGKVGIWGISYPGFYTAAAVMQAHPAIKAASPQAPMADTFIGDDFHHNGAFFLPHAFNFLASFGKPRTGPTTAFPPRFEHGTPDGYRFFLELGTLGNANKRYFHNEIAIWNEYMKHGNYDEYWQAQNVLPHLKNVKPAIMVVGGWFDSEDLYGPLSIYKTIEKNNPNTYNIIVMGPWVHGGWARTDGDQLGNIHFGTKTSFYYRRDIELAFFNHFLKDKGELKLPEAVVFETGSNQWRSYDHWPPVNVKEKSLYFHEKSRLSFEAPKQTTPAFDEYISDPNKPVPFTAEIRNS
ncbi:MAG: CocE/NonD family hydrolase, partial [Blastocatellia bacterium]|nr:CocE/NonD family hydrolase [Blastocatellia bacterium]